MLEAWYMDDDTTVDQREEHRLSPNEHLACQLIRVTHREVRQLERQVNSTHWLPSLVM